MAHYTFVDHWTIRAPIDTVFDHIVRARTYREWWPGYESVELAPGAEPPRVGSIARMLVRSPFGYGLRLDVEIAELDPPRRLLTVSRGDLAGTGLWEFRTVGGATRARWTWSVESSHPLLNALEPVAKKLFEASHNYVSGQGRRGLKRLLERGAFDPDRVAALEAAGWRAYYAREWARMLYLMVALCREQFAMPPTAALRAALYATRGAIAFKPFVHDDALVSRCYERFYAIAARHSTLTFDPRRAARHELRYWDVHRRLSGEPDKGELVGALALLHAELFSISPEAARDSAERRARAAAIVDEITSRRSPEPERDWARLEAELRACYASALDARERARA